MQVKGFGAGVLVDDVAATTRYYREHFGFEVTVELDWFSSLNVGVPGYEISFIRRGHESTPEPYRWQEPSGAMFGFVVEDAAAEEKRLREAGAEIVKPLVDEVYGQRHFFVRDPNGVLVDVIELIAPDPQWLAESGLAG
ncbi:VOC family protein [Amycolatopsis sp. NPDC058986]|uniref:VOC family protein n=1 Tax=unclassified Amycolatopsis TaxID=2618356 RepID=UPI00366C6600